MSSIDAEKALEFLRQLLNESGRVIVIIQLEPPHSVEIGTVYGVEIGAVYVVEIGRIRQRPGGHEWLPEKTSRSHSVETAILDMYIQVFAAS